MSSSFCLLLICVWIHCFSDTVVLLLFTFHFSNFSDDSNSQVSVQYNINVRKCNPNDLDRVHKHQNLNGKYQHWTVDPFMYIIMCYDLAEVGSIDCEIQREKKLFLLFSIILIILQLLRTLEPLVQFRWEFQQNVPLLMSTSVK